MSEIDMILYGLIGLCIFGGLWWLNDQSKYKHKFRVRNLTGTKSVILDDKARIWKDEKGVAYWKLQKMKVIVPLPPPDAISLTNKGIYVVEAYRNELGEFQYITPSSEQNHLSFFQPLTTNQRLILVDQIKKAQMKGGFDWKQHIPMFVGLGMCVIIIVCFLLFFKDAVQPILDAEQNHLQMETYHTEQLELLRDIKYGIQRMGVNMNLTGVPD